MFLSLVCNSIKARARSSLERPGLQCRLANLPRFVQQLGDFFLVAEQQLANRVSHRFMLGGVAPQHMLEEEEMLFVNFGFAFDEGVGLKQAETLAVAPVRGLDVFLVQLAADIGDAAIDMGWDRHLARLLLELR